MSDESIAVALGKLRTIQFVRLPPGHVGLDPADVEAAGLDLDDVRAWVIQNGGLESKIDLPDRSLRPGKLTARSRTVRYLQVPRDQIGA
jgi:hypothetical protein